MNGSKNRGTIKEERILAHILNSPYLCSVNHRNRHDDDAAKCWWEQKQTTMKRKLRTNLNTLKRTENGQERFLRRIIEKRLAQFVHRHIGRSENLLTKYMVLRGTSEQMTAAESEWFQTRRNQYFSKNACMTE